MTARGTDAEAQDFVAIFNPPTPLNDERCIKLSPVTYEPEEAPGRNYN